MRCHFCHEALPFDARADARFCNAACRGAAHRAHAATRTETALALLMEHTRAVIAGEPAEVLAEIATRTDRFLNEAH